MTASCEHGERQHCRYSIARNESNLSGGVYENNGMFSWSHTTRAQVEEDKSAWNISYLGTSVKEKRVIWRTLHDVTFHEMPVPDLAPFGRDFSANRDGERAARVKTTALGRIDRAGHVADENNALAFFFD